MAVPPGGKLRLFSSPAQNVPFGRGPPVTRVVPCSWRKAPQPGPMPLADNTSGQNQAKVLKAGHDPAGVFAREGSGCGRSSRRAPLMTSVGLSQGRLTVAVWLGPFSMIQTNLAR